MTDHTCARCDRPMHHDMALIDAPCANLLRRHLQDVAKIAGDITLTVARLDRVPRTGSVDDLGWWKHDNALEAIPLPYRPEAAERHDAAVNELATWARLISEERNMTIPSYWRVTALGTITRSHPLYRAATFVAANLEWLRHHRDAETAVLSLLVSCADLANVVDTRSPGELVGMCSCGTARYSTDAACTRCHTVELAHDRNDLDKGRDEFVVTASEAARYVADSGLVSDTTKLRKLIWAWADRGHLTAVDDVPRYRLGDVLDRVMASPALLRAS